MFTKHHLKIAGVIVANLALALFLIVFRVEFRAMADSAVDPISATIGQAALLLTWFYGLGVGALLLTGLAIKANRIAKTGN
jgi:hypothetical protein